MRMNGLLHVYTGTGKGKSTAAAGLALRMAGHGQQVLYAQFLKAAPSGEIMAFDRYADLVEVRRPSLRHKAFLWNQSEQQRLETAVDLRLGWEALSQLLTNPFYRLFVFDELLDVLEMGFVSEAEVAQRIAGRHADAEVVLTGRTVPDSLLQLADYATEMTLRKHPYENGIQARKGVEW